jgi:NAD(P)-dependent dehydrogenase (short-subunit alcohol dehydrogenase family)
LPSQETTLSGKVAVVTGSSRGIGRAIAVRFAREGARVVVHGTDAVRAGAVVEEIVSAGGMAAVCLGDVAEDGFGERLAQFAVERFGAVDIFVASAGMAGFAPFLEMTADAFRAFMEVHVTGAFTTSQACAKKMVEAGRGGRILYLSSISAMNAMYGYAAYCSAKSAVMALTRVAALELARHGITANAIAPGPVQSEMMEELWGPERMKERCQGIPLGKLAQTGDVAEMALFLASPAAQYLTGQAFFVDGGALAAGPYTHEVFKRSEAIIPAAAPQMD